MLCLKDDNAQYGWYNPVGYFAGGYETPEEESARLNEVLKQLKEERIISNIHNDLTIMEMMRHHSICEAKQAIEK